MYRINEKGDECAKVHEGLPMPQKDKLGKACIDMEKYIPYGYAPKIRMESSKKQGREQIKQLA